MPARRLFGSAFRVVRRISTRIEIPPEIVKEISKINTNAPKNQVVPNSTQIDECKKELERIYEEQIKFREVADELYKACNKSVVKSIAVSFKRVEESGRTNVNPFFQPTLIATSLLAGMGYKPFYNKENCLAFTLVDPNNKNAISGHQDSIILKNTPSLMPAFLLVNGYSTSKAITWVKESADIISELKEKYPSSYEILKKLNFSYRSKNSDESGTRRIIGDDDEINFVSNFIYNPVPTDLKRFNIFKDEADLAILRFREVVNSQENRHQFVINNKCVQILFVKNLDSLHGRGEVEKGADRLLIGIPLNQPASEAVAPIDSSKVNKQEKIKTA